MESVCPARVTQFSQSEQTEVESISPEFDILSNKLIMLIRIISLSCYEVTNSNNQSYKALYLESIVQ